MSIDPLEFHKRGPCSMRITRRTWALLGVVALAGCRAPSVRITSPAKTPSGPTRPSELPPAAATSLEPDYAKLPILDPRTAAAQLPVTPRAPLVEATVIKLASERAALPTVLQRESEIPQLLAATSAQPTGDDGALLREVRTLLAADARSKAVGEALDEFYRLADVEGRLDLLRISIDRLDSLLEAAKKAKAEGARLPVELDELDVQRANLLAILGQAELGAKLLDTDLKRRLGLSSQMTERLLPAGEFAVSSAEVDAEASVKLALENRADLQALRTAYLGLTPESLPSVQQYLRGVPGAVGLVGNGTIVNPPKWENRVLVARLFHRRVDAWAKAIDTVTAAEVAVRRQQLYRLIEEKERATADETRAAVAALNEQTRRVGLTRWRAEQQKTKLADVKKMAKGPFLEVPAELETLRARSDLIAAVMQWHQAKSKLAIAEGRFGGVIK